MPSAGWPQPSAAGARRAARECTRGGRHASRTRWPARALGREPSGAASCARRARGCTQYEQAQRGNAPTSSMRHAAERVAGKRARGEEAPTCRAARWRSSRSVTDEMVVTSASGCRARWPSPRPEITPVRAAPAKRKVSQSRVAVRMGLQRCAGWRCGACVQGIDQRDPAITSPEAGRSHGAMWGRCALWGGAGGHAASSPHRTSESTYLLAVPCCIDGMGRSCAAAHGVRCIPIVTGRREPSWGMGMARPSEKSRWSRAGGNDFRERPKC